MIPHRLVIAFVPCIVEMRKGAILRITMVSLKDVWMLITQEMSVSLQRMLESLRLIVSSTYLLYNEVGGNKGTTLIRVRWDSDPRHSNPG